MTGVMWSCFLVRVMNRAALCWRSCRRWMSLSKLQLSSMEVSKKWTSCSVAHDVRNLTIFPIMWIWYDLIQCADLFLHTAMRVKYYTQIFTWGLIETVESPNFIVEILRLFRRDVEPVMTKFFRHSVAVYRLLYHPFFNFIYALLQFSDGTCCI